MRRERSMFRSPTSARRYGFVSFAIALAMSVIGLPVAAQAASSNQPQITAMTDNLFQGSELTDAISATTPAKLFAAAAKDYGQVQTANFPERAQAIAAQAQSAAPDLIGAQGAALWKTGAPSVTYPPLLARWLLAAGPQTIKERSCPDVLVGSTLENPFDLGIDTDRHERHWVTVMPGVLTLAYPARQQWGAMFITVGPSSPAGHRHSIDLSLCRSLSVQLRARANGQRVRLGIKDWSQPDNGGEITIEETLTTRWSTVALPLSLFANVDRRHLYVVFELVFQGSAAETVDMRDLRYALTAVPAPVFRPAPMPFPVYTDGGDPGNHYVPSGFMGDLRAVTMNEYWAGHPHRGKTCIQVSYHGTVPGGLGWAGVYWQSPVDNWGIVPGPAGYNLKRAMRLTFWVRGQTGAERVQFRVGGITGRYGDSLPAVTTQVLTLSTSWQQVTITLTGKDLTHVIGGFGWVANTQDDPRGAIFYLDDIVYSA